MAALKGESPSLEVPSDEEKRKISPGRPPNFVRAISRHCQTIEDLYRIERRLGKGGFSEVMLGTDRRDGTKWALKIIDGEVFVKNRRRTEEEVKLLAALEHPGIVKLKEILRTPSKFVIVMEVLTGQELFDRIVAKNSYQENDAKLVALSILDAINYLHDHEVVHRDLKPENLIFDMPGDDARLKLTDFGFATMYDPNKKLVSTCGTPEYVAPEILNEQPYGTQVDMWSFGVVLYILLCGFPPFYGATEMEMFNKICSAKFRFLKPHWDNVSDNAKDLVKKLLTVDPRQRLTAPQALEHPWFANIVDLTPEQIASQNSSDLTPAMKHFRSYNATRKFRKGVLAVMAANKIRVFVQSQLEELGIQGTPTGLSQLGGLDSIKLLAVPEANQSKFNKNNVIQHN